MTFNNIFKYLHELETGFLKIKFSQIISIDSLMWSPLYLDCQTFFDTDFQYKNKISSKCALWRKWNKIASSSTFSWMLLNVMNSYPPREFWQYNHIQNILGSGTIVTIKSLLHCCVQIKQLLILNHYQKILVIIKITIKTHIQTSCSSPSPPWVWLAGIREA